MGRISDTREHCMTPPWFPLPPWLTLRIPALSRGSRSCKWLHGLQELDAYTIPHTSLSTEKKQQTPRVFSLILIFEWQKLHLQSRTKYAILSDASRGATGVNIRMKTELIEKASRIVGDNQLFVNIVSKRVQQINHGADPYVPTTPEMGSGDIALTEIIEGKLQWREESETSTASDPFDELSSEEPKA